MLLRYLGGGVTFFEMLSYMLALVTALTIHEFAHAYSAWRLGDDTAKRMGRVSLNPLVHFDPIGTTLILLGGFGWGKPVPVDPLRLKHPRSGLIWVSLWGPLSNILTACALALLIGHTPLMHHEAMAFLTLYVYFTLTLSLMLAFFNLLPITPLDGSKVLSGLLPLGQAKRYDRFMMVWGMPLLIGVIFILPEFFGIRLVRYWVSVPTELFFRAFGLGV